MSSKKISIDQIREIVQDIERNSQYDPANLQKIYNELNEAIAEFQAATLSGDKVKSGKMAEMVSRLNQEKDVQKSLSYVAANGGLKHQLKKSSGLEELCKKFEAQELAAADDLLAQRDQLINDFKATRRAFLRIVRALGENNNALLHKCGDLSAAAEHRSDLTNEEKQGYHSKYQHLTFDRIDIAQKEREVFSCAHHGIPMSAEMEADLAVEAE